MAVNLPVGTRKQREKEPDGKQRGRPILKSEFSGFVGGNSLVLMQKKSKVVPGRERGESPGSELSTTLTIYYQRTMEWFRLEKPS